MLRIALLIGFIATASPVFAVHIDLFVAGGQSNAKPEWKDAIAATLADSGRFDQVEVVHSFRSGSWLSGWFTDESGIGQRQSYYLADFYDPDPSAEGALERRIREITEAGNTYTLHGLFWFQGEGDTGSSSSANNYGETFLLMRDTLAADVGVGGLPFVIALIDGNEDYFTGGSLPPSRYARIAIVRAEQQWAAESAERAAWYDTAHYPRGDAWHLSKSDLVLVGEGMATAYLNLPEPATIILLGGAVLVFCRRKMAA